MHGFELYMNLALNNLQGLKCHKNKQPTESIQSFTTQEHEK